MTAALLRRRIAYRLKRLGWPGNLGLALLIAASVYAAVVFPAADRQAARIDQQLLAARAKQHAAETNPDALRPKTPAEQLTDFYQVFPPGTTVPDWLGQIYAMADAQKLALDIGEYSLTRAPSGRLDRFRIVLPVKGSYPQIRKFIAAALSTAPALALDGIYLKRDKVEESAVDARIVFLLYLEKGA